jgi:hypothetical protein
MPLKAAATKLPTNKYSESGSKMTEDTAFQGPCSANIMEQTVTFLYDYSPEPHREDAIQTAPAFIYDRGTVPY